MRNNKFRIFIFGCLLAVAVISLGFLIKTTLMSSKEESKDVATHPEAKEIEVNSSQKSYLQNPIQTGFDERNADVSKTEAVAPPVETEDRFLQLDKELRSLTLKEIVARLEDMDLDDFRILMSAQWFKTLVDEDTRTLSTEEYITFEMVYRKSLGGAWEKDYEEFFGRTAPPPGYVWNSTDGGEYKLLRINTPTKRIRVSETEGYEKWDNLSASEFKQYLLLNTIVNIEPGFSEDYNREISQAVIDEAKEMRQPLYEKSWGTHTTYSAGVIGYWTRDKTAADLALEEQLKAEAHAEIDAQTQQSTQQSSTHDYGFHRDDVATLISEIETKLGHQ